MKVRFLETKVVYLTLQLINSFTVAVFPNNNKISFDY